MFPLNFWDISLLMAIIAIILFVSSVMLSSSSGKVNILINKKRLRGAAIVATIIFLISTALRIVSLIITQ